MAYSLNPISLDKAMSYCPALIGTPAAKTSDAYEHIPTIDVLKALTKEGFHIHGVQGLRSRTPERREVGKHMIRLRQSNAIVKVGEEYPEVILINSHDGTCAYRMSAGLVRLVCSNGMTVAGAQYTNVAVRHQGAETIGKVIEGTFKVIEDFPKIAEQVETMKALAMKPEEQVILAKAALQLRYPDEDKAVEVRPERILRAQRYEDRKDDLWTTFNKVQEHLIRGGARGTKKDEQGIPRAASIRAVNSIDGDVTLNKALWTLATEMAKLKAA